MTPSQFLTELNQLLAQMDWPEWASKTGNQASPPTDPADIDALTAAFPLPEQLREFFRHCGRLWLVDIHNGYRLDGPAHILASAQSDSMPLRVQCLNPAKSGPILFFGSDGGGSTFAIRTDHRTEVLFLKGEATIENSAWSERDRLLLRVLAPDFNSFLDLLLQDVRAFVTDKQCWSYMTDWKWTPNSQ